MVAERSKALAQIHVERMPGLNPARDYDLDGSEIEITCGYSSWVK